MPNLKLYMKFDYTDAGGNTYSDGSTSTAKTISIETDDIFDRTYSIANTTITEIWSDSTQSNGFDFLWIESDQAGEIQFVCNEGGTLSGNNIENGFVFALTAGVPFVLSNDDSRNMGNMDGTFFDTNHQAEIDTWETHWAADTIDRIEWYNGTGGTANVRLFAAT